MKALCNGTQMCVQCGQPMLDGERRTCPKFRAVPAASEQATTARTLGLGDWTEQLLSSVGVTKERYIEAKERFGLAPTCGCADRQEWLNRVGRWVTSKFTST